jgi:hypothetical protein
VAGVLDHAALGIGQEHFPSHVQATSGMLACCLSGVRFPRGILRSRLTDKQCVPVPIRAHDQLRRDRRTLKGAMPLDFQQSPRLGRHMHVCAVLVKPDIPTHRVLAHVNRVPAVGRLEAREATRHAQVFQLKVALERLAESRSASVCTVVAGTVSPPRPLKRAVKAYFVGNVPSAAYCAFNASSISLSMARASVRQAINCWRCARFGYSRYANVRTSYSYHRGCEAAKPRGTSIV